MSKAPTRTASNSPAPATPAPANNVPEQVSVACHRVSCDGTGGIRSNPNLPFAPSALGHPRIWLEIDARGYVDCPYCDKRFVLEGGTAQAH